ncbi:MAG: hypothetical protein R3C53_28310 [Pirellulaceae bacterium]
MLNLQQFNPLAKSIPSIIALGLLVTALSATAWSQALPTSTGRKLAPDALNVIAPGVEYGDTFQGPVDLPFVAQHPELVWTPEYAPVTDTLIEKGKQVVFRGDAYSLEFAFKPVRMIEVNGQNVWYLLYRVRYLGGDLKPKSEQDQYNNQVFATPEAVSAAWVRFLPLFTLDVKGVNKRYVDRIVPGAKQLIAAKERVGKPIYDSVEIQRLKIEITTEAEDNSVWGVAMWNNVDPRTDFFAVEVRGLTNAQRIESAGESLKYLQKILVLHFSRPGDTINELDDRIRYGIPALEDPKRQQYVLDQFGIQERLDHMWVYR